MEQRERERGTTTRFEFWLSKHVVVVAERVRVCDACGRYRARALRHDSQGISSRTRRGTESLQPLNLLAAVLASRDAQKLLSHRDQGMRACD